MQIKIEQNPKPKYNSLEEAQAALLHSLARILATEIKAELFGQNGGRQNNENIQRIPDNKTQPLDSLPIRHPPNPGHPQNLHQPGPNGTGGAK